MKYLIFSDIHGSETAAHKIIEKFNELKCDFMILLGDVLYHGPRNNLPEEYNPKAVAELLNQYSGKIIACRGNCDAEVEEMVLNFPVRADYSFTVDNGVRIFGTHGHVFSPIRSNGQLAVPKSKEIPLTMGSEKGCIELYGHTHIQVLEKNADGIVVCNPGSVSIPKGGTPAGFAVYENGTVTLFSLEGTELKKQRL